MVNKITKSLKILNLNYSKEPRAPNISIIKSLVEF
jgi:hypothetical protein